MKKYAFFSLTLLLSFSLLYSSCKKDDDTKEEEESSTAQTTQSTDEYTFQMESDNILNEVNTAVSGSTFAKTSPIVGATIDDSTYIQSKKIVITYNGNSADGFRHRTGTITAQLIAGSNWGEAGATLKIDCQNFVVTHIQSGKKITLNGSHTINNVNGGRITFNSTVTYRVRGTMNLFFDNNSSSQLSWHVARKHTIVVGTTHYTITTEGDTSINNTSNIAVWGNNRFANAFYTQIKTPLVLNSNCPYRFTAGEKVHKGLQHEINVHFAVDANGNAITSGCPYGIKISWTNARNITRTVVVSY